MNVMFMGVNHGGGGGGGDISPNIWGGSVNPCALDTHGLSTSWALFNGASIDQIQKAAFWSNSNSFISCYLWDMSLPTRPHSVWPLLVHPGPLASALWARGSPIPVNFPFTTSLFNYFWWDLCYSAVSRKNKLLSGNHVIYIWFTYLWMISAHLFVSIPPFPPFHSKTGLAQERRKDILAQSRCLPGWVSLGRRPRINTLSCFLLCFIYHKYLNPKVIRYVMYTLIQINRSQHAFVIKWPFNKECYRVSVSKYD